MEPPEPPSYLKHKQIRGACFFADDEVHVDPIFSAVDEVGTFGPAEFQEAANEVLDLLLEHALSKKGAKHQASKLQQLQSAMAFLHDVFYEELGAGFS